MYKYSKTITLVTIASPTAQNLALLDVNEFLSADSLAVIHNGYVNVIPVFNDTRRCKYVALQKGKDRGKGLIKQIKWLRINGETFLILASTIGIQVYDAEVCDVRFSHNCNTAVVNGVCVIKNILYIGTDAGTIGLFELSHQNTELNLIDLIKIHDAPITLLDGMDKYLITCTHRSAYLWIIKERNNELKMARHINVSGLTAKPTTLKVSNYLIFIGYESGEFCIYDILDETYTARTVAHKLQITAFDFSPLKHLILTASEDCYIKLWTFTEDCIEGKCIFNLLNDGPVCGVAFLNYNCTEFCCVTANNVSVNCYIEVQKKE